MRHTTSLVLALATLLLAGEVRAADRADAKVHVGLQAGVFLPQVATELGTSPGVKLEGGYRVWKNLAAQLAVGYSQPPASPGEPDPRLTAGSYDADVTQRELSISIGGLWWFLPTEARLNVYGGLAFRTYMLETITNGSSGGMSFLENRETSTRYGGVASVGGEFRIGPGALVGELEVSGSSLPHAITGDVSTTGVGVNVGYRMFF